MSDESRLKATIFIGGLAQTVQSKTLHDAFIPFGEIADISLPKPEAPSSTDTHRGFGYIEFSSPPDALDAIDNMDQSLLFGRVIKVAAAKPSQAAQLHGSAGQGEREGVLGSKTALWEQEGYLSRVNGGGGEEEEKEDIEEGPMNGLSGLDVAGPSRA